MVSYPLQNLRVLQQSPIACFCCFDVLETIGDYLDVEQIDRRLSIILEAQMHATQRN